MDVIADFEAVIREVREAKPVPFSASAIVDRKELLERLQGLVEALPGELQKARWVIEDRDEVLGRIQQEAQKTLEQARRERERMLSRPEVERAASIEAERIIESAKTQAREVRIEAEHFVDGKLASLEVGLQKMLALVQSAAGAFPDRSAPVRSGPSPKRAAAPRPPAEGGKAGGRSSVPTAGDARSGNASSGERRPAPRSRPVPPVDRPRAPRPARGPAASGPSYAQRPDLTPDPPPSGGPPPGTVRSLGLGSPQVRAKPAPRAGQRSQAAKGDRLRQAGTPAAQDVIRLDEAPEAPEAATARPIALDRPNAPRAPASHPGASSDPRYESPEPGSPNALF